MRRRQFLRSLTTPLLALLGIRLAGCGASENRSALASDDELPATLPIWSYYVPLTDYAGLIEDFEGRDANDRKVIFEEARRRTSRISGRRDDGTSNRASLDVNALREAESYLRVPFWHDDTDQSGQRGHTLFIYKRYLESLAAGETIYLATGTIQGHFHVVMISPRT